MRGDGVVTVFLRFVAVWHGPLLFKGSFDYISIIIEITLRMTHSRGRAPPLTICVESKAMLGGAPNTAIRTGPPRCGVAHSRW